MSAYVDAMARGFESELQKIAAEKRSQAGNFSLLKNVVLPGGLAIGAYKVLENAEKDRRLGRQLRAQQQSRF